MDTNEKVLLNIAGREQDNEEVVFDFDDDELYYTALLKAFTWKYPALSVIGSILNKKIARTEEEKKKCPTAYVCFVDNPDNENYNEIGGIEMMVNLDFMKSLNPVHQISVIAHEILHVAYGHLHLSNYARKENENFYPLIWNIAADIIVNHPLKGSLDIQAITADEYMPEYEPDNHTVMDVYQYLLRSGKVDNFKCQCASGGGKNPFPGKAGPYSKDGKDKSSGKVDGAEGGTFDRNGTHPWEYEGDIDTVKHSEDKLAGQLSEMWEEIQAQMSEDAACKNKGYDVFKHLVKIQVRPVETVIDYKKYLKRKVEIFLSPTRILTVKRFSRRFAGQKGRKMNRRNNHILICIDTSGSMHDSLIAEAGGVILDVQRKMRCKMDYLTYAIHVSDPRPVHAGLKDVVCEDRGGTSMDNVYEYLVEKKLTDVYKNLIFITDGYDTYPETYNTLKDKPDVLTYVITPDGSTNFPGTVYRRENLIKEQE